MAKFKNTTTSVTELIPKVKDRGAISNIYISNTTTTEEADIDLYLDDGVDQFYIISRVKIPVGVTLLLDDDLSFDSSLYSLKITNHASTRSLTVKIRN
jgi:hypothetical protein